MLHLAICLFLCFFGLLASDADSIEKKYIPALDITEITLQNGMKVVLKPTNYEIGEVLVNITAMGGFAAFPKEGRGSYELAPLIALESGLGRLTSDQLSVYMYEHSIEFNPKILPFSRVLEGMTDRQGLEKLLKIIKSYFTEAQFTKTGFDIVVKQSKESLQKRLSDRDTRFEDAFIQVNTQNYFYLSPMTKEMVEKADFSTSKNFFENAFGDPSQFVCVIVGDFRLEQNIPIIQETLGTIPKRDSKNTFKNYTIPPFPPGVTAKKVKIAGRSDSLARITFPLIRQLSPPELQYFQVVCQVLEDGLRDSFREKTKSSMGISIAYEFPLFPLRDLSWLVIQYRADPKMVMKIKDMIFDELLLLKEKGASEERLQRVLLNMVREDEFWLKENSYWVATLSNDYIWGWDPVQDIKSFEKPKGMSTDKVKQIISDYIPLNNYTIIYSEP